MRAASRAELDRRAAGIPGRSRRRTFRHGGGKRILLQGLGGTGDRRISFGVPAAFFYALGAKMDKTTTAVQRYQMATGDAIDRLLQEFAAAEDQA